MEQDSWTSYNARDRILAHFLSELKNITERSYLISIALSPHGPENQKHVDLVLEQGETDEAAITATNGMINSNITTMKFSSCRS